MSKRVGVHVRLPLKGGRQRDRDVRGKPHPAQIDSSSPVCLCRKLLCLRSKSMLLVPAATVRGDCGLLLGDPGSFSDEGLRMRLGYAMSARSDRGVPPISASSLRTRSARS